MLSGASWWNAERRFLVHPRLVTDTRRGTTEYLLLGAHTQELRNEVEWRRSTLSDHYNIM